MAKGVIIFLNGASSSGKTSLAHLLQAQLARPAYHLSQDLFTQMASKTHRMADFWAVTNTTISAMHHTIALFSDLGLDVIVDHVLLDTPHGQISLRECVQLLHAHPVLFVRVECPLEELERREQQRCDRRVGQARSMEYMISPWTHIRRRWRDVPIKSLPPYRIRHVGARFEPYMNAGQALNKSPLLLSSSNLFTRLLLGSLPSWKRISPTASVATIFREVVLTRRLHRSVIMCILAPTCIFPLLRHLGRNAHR